MRKSLKTATTILIVISMLMTWAVFVSADNGEPDDPYYIPLGRAFGFAGGTASWDEENFRIVATYGDDTFFFFLHSSDALFNEEEVTLNFVIYVEDDRSFISYFDVAFLFDDSSGSFSETIMTAVLTSMYYMDILSIPGITVALVDAETGYTWTQGFGFADSDAGSYINEQTLFNLASISKTFTAVAVMQLVEEGIIDLDEPLVTYLPEFNTLPDLGGDGDYHNITVRMLLSHASGIVPDLMVPGVATINEYNPDYMNGFLDTIAEYNMITPEASVFTYSNNAFNLLGILVAVMSGYDDYFDGFVSYTQENIFDIAGMELTTFELEDFHMPYVSQSYVSTGIMADLVYFNSLPAGGIFSNAHDMARFMHTILSGGIYEGEQLLSEDSIALMLEQQDYDFELAPNILAPNMVPGLGLLYSTGFNGFTHVGHSGNMVHFHSDMAFDPDSGLGVFVSTNSITGMALVRDLCTIILTNAIFEKTGMIDVPAPVMAEPIELTLEELQAFEGIYTMAGDSQFTRIVAGDDGFLYMFDFSSIPYPLALIPLSDGSFFSMDFEFRLWFEDFFGDTLVYIGDYKSHLMGGLLDPELYAANEDFYLWEGMYIAVVENENYVSIISHVEVGTDVNGIAFVRLYALHGATPISPLIYLGDDVYYAGDLIKFTSDADSAWVTILGATFERME